MFVNAPSDHVSSAPPPPVQPTTLDSTHDPSTAYQAGAMPVAPLPPQHMGQAQAQAWEAVKSPMPTWAKVVGGSLLAWTLWRYFR